VSHDRSFNFGGGGAVSQVPSASVTATTIFQGLNNDSGNASMLQTGRKDPIPLNIHSKERSEPTSAFKDQNRPGTSITLRQHELAKDSPGSILDINKKGNGGNPAGHQSNVQVREDNTHIDLGGAVLAFQHPANAEDGGNI
jgi:hypothetical protein